MDKYKRPEVLNSTTQKSGTGCGNIYLTNTYDKYMVPREMFLTKGHMGGCICSLMVIISRLASTALRHGVGLEDILKQVKDERCPVSVNVIPLVLSCGDAIAKAIEEFCNLRKEFLRDEKEQKATKEVPSLRRRDEIPYTLPYRLFS